MTQKPAGTDMSGDPVVRVLGGYLASVTTAVATFALLGVVEQVVVPSVAVSAETTVTIPGDWMTVAITLGMAWFLVGLFALPGFLLCLAVSVRACLQHPAIHVTCGCAIGLGLWQLFSGLVDRPIPAAMAGAMGGGIYWSLAVPKHSGRPQLPLPDTLTIPTFKRDADQHLAGCVVTVTTNLSDFETLAPHCRRQALCSGQGPGASPLRRTTPQHPSPGLLEVGTLVAGLALGMVQLAISQSDEVADKRLSSAR